MNGDGVSDIMVGATRYDLHPFSPGEGTVFVYLGNKGGRGWTQAAQQRLDTNAAPIALLGDSSSQRHFRIRTEFEHTLTGFQWASPKGAKARLEWEVVGLDDRFDETTIHWGRFEPLAKAPLTFNELVYFPTASPGSPAHGKDPPRLYKWRVRALTNNPVLPVTPWVSMPGNNVTESKLRPLDGVRSR